MDYDRTPKPGKTGRRLSPEEKAARKRKKRIRRDLILAGILILLLFVIWLVFYLFTHAVAPAVKKPAKQVESQMESQAIKESEEQAIQESIEAEEERKAQVSTVTLMAVGDNLIHNTLYEAAEQDDGTYDFTPMYRYLLEDIQSADLACIQQETIFVSDPDLYSNYPRFGTPIKMADDLVTVGFDVIEEASNHAYDKRETGLTDTLNKWKEYPEVTVLGIHETQEAADALTIVEKNGIKIAMFDYTYALNGDGPEEDYKIDILTEENRTHIGEMLDRASTEADISIVFMHAGIEGDFEASDFQKDWAQFFSDHGVSVVIGSHPHVVQPVTELTGVNGNKTIVYYSLGNFVSHQAERYNMLEAMANLTITKDYTGTYVSDYTVSPIVNVIEKKGGSYKIYAVHLEDYTDDMADSQWVDGCSVEYMNDLWNDVMSTEPI